MAGIIDFYFDFVSPFGWIAAENIGALAARHGRTIRWHPFLLKVAVVDVMNLRPILETPLKGPYMWHDARRSAGLRGLTIAENVNARFSPVAASRAVIWTRAQGIDVEPLVLALYRRQWRDGGDIADLEQIQDMAAGVGLDGRVMIEAADTPAMKTAFRTEVDAAIARGVFGSPTTIVDGEMFWGSDRLDHIDLWLSK